MKLYFVGNSLFSMMATSPFWVVLCFYCLFSYPGLLELHYGGWVKKSQIAKEWARETGTLGEKSGAEDRC